MKKVLIVTYYWPPSGGPGVQRVLRFAKYLPQFGWQPIVLTVKNGDFPAVDNSLGNEIPKEVKVYKTLTIEPFTIYKWLTGKKKNAKIDTYILTNKKKSFFERFAHFIRMNIFIPDARIGWMSFAVKAGMKIIKEENIDVIYSCSPPHSLQLIANKLAKKSKLKWVADFRDPWMEFVTYQTMNPNSYPFRRNIKLQHKVFNNTDRIITTCDGFTRLINEKYQIPKEKIQTITNGFDAEFIDKVAPSENKKITLIHTGTLPKERIPYSLLKVLQSESYKNIELKFIGNISDEVKKEISKFNLQNIVVYNPYIPYQEVIAEIKSSTACILPIDNVPNNDLFIAGKLFDYLGCGIPVLGLGKKGCSVDNILRETGSGVLFDYDDVEGIKDFIEQRLKEKILSGQNKNVKNYERKELSRRLAEIFDGLS